MHPPRSSQRRSGGTELTSAGLRAASALAFSLARGRSLPSAVRRVTLLLGAGELQRILSQREARRAAARRRRIRRSLVAGAVLGAAAGTATVRGHRH